MSSVPLLPTVDDLAARRPLLPVIGGDLRIPLVTGAVVRSVNLDYAASAPALASVTRTVDEVLPWYSSVHRGAGFGSTVCSELLEASRSEIRWSLGGRADDVVVFTRNTTDGLNLLARCLPDDTMVFTLDIEHHANLLPWRSGSVVHLPTPPTIEEVAGVFAAALASNTSRHAVVSITGASNVTGEVLPIAEIASVAHRFGARIVVDAAQLAPHRRIDIAALDVDYLVLSGHKLYAPFGAGVLIGRSDWLDAAPPYLAGGGAVQQVWLDTVRWAPAPARHEGGTPNVVGAVAIAAALRALREVGWDQVEEHDERLRTQLREQLDEVAGVEALSVFGADSDRVGIVTITTPRSSGLVAAALSAEHGIATRDGAFCAHPLMRRLAGVAADASVPHAIRASIGVGSTTADLERFVQALAEIVADGPRWPYELTNGRLVPAPDPRPRPFAGLFP